MRCGSPVKPYSIQIPTPVVLNIRELPIMPDSPERTRANLSALVWYLKVAFGVDANGDRRQVKRAGGYFSNIRAI